MTYLVTGTLHGSIIDAETEGEARRAFHDRWNGESIVQVKTSTLPSWAY